MDILGIDIHLVEQEFLQETHGTGRTLGQRIILADIEDDYIGKAELTGLVHAHQFGIYGVSTYPRTQSQHTVTVLGLALVD